MSAIDWIIDHWILVLSILACAIAVAVYVGLRWRAKNIVYRGHVVAKHFSPGTVVFMPTYTRSDSWAVTIEGRKRDGEIGCWSWDVSRKSFHELAIGDAVRFDR